MFARVRSASVARSVLFVVGTALIVMETIAVGYRATAEWGAIQVRGEQRAAAALDFLEALHTQAMMQSRSVSGADPAIATLDGATHQLSHVDNETRLWMTMGPKLVADLAAKRATDSSIANVELPRDRIDHAAIGTRQESQGFVDGWLRIARPSVLGVAEAAHPRCVSCHMSETNLKLGDVIGTYSVGINLSGARGQWRSHILFEMLTALGIVVTSLAIVATLLNRTTLSPLRKLTAATRRLANGSLHIDFDGAERGDELGTLARALDVFRSNLLDKRKAEEKIAHMAGHDILTGLPNRASLNRFLIEAVAAATGGAKIGVVSVDLDALRLVNDLHGQSAGDSVLQSVAGSLIDNVGGGEFVARVGGDEFVAVKSFKSQAELSDFVARVTQALQADTQVGLGSQPSAHLGVAIWPDDATTPDALLAKADQALECAKAEKTCGAYYYKAELDEAARRRRQIVTALATAVERGELCLNYQVQKSLSDLRNIGYEALLRWQHPELGAVSPAEFIPLAEQGGAIVDIGEWVLRTACTEGVRWPDPIRVAVNISPVQIAHGGLPDLVHRVLFETGLAPERLELEITETAIIADKAQALQTLRKIKALGVSIALDDFGCGYSSFETLRIFPFDKIKIDRLFITELATSNEAKAIIRAVIALGQILSIPILAEGVETEEQLAILRYEQCSDAQGYLFGKPLPHVDLSEDARHAC